MRHPTREEAWNLVAEYVNSESLRRHCLAVEAAMRAYARKFGEDGEVWGLCGLLHDFDYEKYPDWEHGGHPFKGSEILREKGYPEEIIQTILSHANYSGVPRDTLIRKVLFAVDELCGFIMAVAHIRPTKLEGLTVESVEKRLKMKSFAAKVSREDIDEGVAGLGVPRAEHVALVITALAGISNLLFPAP